MDKLHRLAWLDAWTLVRPWMVTSSLGNALLLAHCAQIIAQGFDMPPTTATLPLALSAGFLVLSTLRYLDYSPGLYSTILTMAGAGPRIIRFLVGVAPLFVALGLFALVVFGRTEARWCNPTIAFITLFAFYNGDALRETYEHTESEASGFLTTVGDLHLCLTILIFTYVVTNCCIALVEEAFFNTRTADAQDLVREARLKMLRIRRAIVELLTAVDTASSDAVRLHKCDDHAGDSLAAPLLLPADMPLLA